MGASYLLGSIVGSLLVGRLRGGIDIRALGSGNPGGTNALRTQGKSFALWVMLIDIGKGWLAAHSIAALPVPVVGPASTELGLWLPPACGIAAIVGHVYPVWYGFRGGKGVATFVGVVLGVNPLLLLPVLLTWLLVIGLTGFVGLASITAAASLPVYIAWGRIEPRTPLLTFGLIAGLLIALTHRGNLARMRAGDEPRARRLWLLGRHRTKA